VVNSDSQISRLYLETLKHLKQDCYPEYGTIYPIRLHIEATDKDEVDIKVFLTLLAGLGQDGVLFELDNKKTPDTVLSIKHWVDSINKFKFVF